MSIEKQLQIRKQRGYEIAKMNKGRIVNVNGIWIVPSQSSPTKTYEVTLSLNDSKCTCEDYAERKIKCKHYFAVQYSLTKTKNKDGTVTVTETKKVTFSQNWKAYDMATIQQKELYLKLLNHLCNNVEEPAYTFGRPKMALKDMVFSSALKVFTTFSLRRFSTDMREAQAKGYIAKVPYYSTVARYMENPELTPILKNLIMLSSLPLKAVEGKSFSIDSSGISPAKFSRWFDHKYGHETNRKIWYKVHVVTGNKTNVVCAVEVTSQYVSDSTMMPQLADEARANFDIGILAADKGYSSQKNMVEMGDRGILPFIPFKSNTRTPEGNNMWRQMYDFFTFRREEFLLYYHKRSNVETTFHMIKSKFGDYVRSKTETACINEILLKVLCHNLCVVIQETYELGIQANFT